MDAWKFIRFYGLVVELYAHKFVCCVCGCLLSVTCQVAMDNTIYADEST